MREASDLFRAGRYTESLRKYQNIRSLADHQGDLDYVARATANIGGCQFALRRYQPALGAFLDARRMALAVGDTDVAAAFEANIASLYAELGDLESATQWIKDSLTHIAGRDREDHLARLQIQMGVLLARQKEPQAWLYFQQAIEGADRAGDLESYALGLNRMGQEYLRAADPDPGEPPGDASLRPQLLQRAEAAMMEDFRVRKLHHISLDSTYRNLGSLRLAQGDLSAAATLLDRAVELSCSPQGMLPSWDVYYRRGLVRLRQGHTRQALQDLRLAVRLGRTWRWSTPPDPAARISAEHSLSKVHAALIEAGNRLYLQTGDPALARETFEAAEENRANSLRSIAGQANPEQMPPSFWEALAALQNAEVRALRSPDNAAEAALDAAHARLVALEVSVGSAYRPQPGGILDGVRRALPADAAWLGFRLDDDQSWLWAVDRQGLVLYRLPPRAWIQGQIAAAVDDIRQDSPSAPESSRALYQTLFGGLAPRFKNKSRWLLALDHELFGVPVSALREPVGGRTRYVVENHITQVVPSAGYWLDSLQRRPKLANPSLFVGVGDPIYNTADSRWPKPPLTQRAGFLPFDLLSARQPNRPTLMLPRLVASASELEACARAWRGARVLLEGPTACRRELLERQLREPGVIHFATHFLEPRGEQSDGVIALGLTSSGEVDLLTPEEIAHRPGRAGLVVLSGCHSGAGEVLPGAGLLGLTRAFLASGASGVISSRWATPDDEGALFASLYAHLGTAGPTDAGAALRTAQLAMLHSGGRRARPDYWSAYFLVGSYEF